MQAGDRIRASKSRAVLGCVFVLTAVSSCSSDRGGSRGMADAGADAEADAGDDGGSNPDEGGVAPGCSEISFVTPAAGRALDERDDLDGDQCANGFQYDVIVATTAPDGTRGVLYAGGTQVATAEVRGALLNFEDTQLTSNGTSELSVQVGGATCTAKREVTVSCSVPTCELTKPVVSPTHPKLNGVAAANGGDRVSPEDAPYQVAVEVTTSIEDGQPVELIVDNAPLALSAQADGGKAVFAGVTLATDGSHTIEAVCRGQSGLVGRSVKATYVVDATAPEFTVTSPSEGQHFEDVETFQVCGTTSAADARDLPDALGATAQRNFCARVGNSTATCELMVGAAGEAEDASACVQIPCPGGPPFDLRVSLRDDAGNVQTQLVKSVSCRSERPGVEIVSPIAYEPGNTATNVLAASAAQAQRDLDDATKGAQFTVVACTDAANASMQLMVGLSGETLAEVGEPVAVKLAGVSDGCPAGKPYVAEFTHVTLPESIENSVGALVTPTRLVAQVTDESSSVGASPPVDVWVDSAEPTLSLTTPVCGDFFQGTGTQTRQVRLSSAVLPVTVRVTHQDMSFEERTGTAYAAQSTLVFNSVPFEEGVNLVESSITEPSGNRASLPQTCTVTIGNPPVVTWTTPSQGSKLNASNDASPEPGWQGTLRVHTDLAGVSPTPTVQFATNVGGPLGSPVAIDASGDATLTDVTVPSGNSVQISATTSDVEGRGIGRATIVATVDASPPAAVTQLVANVPENLRRQTTFRLSWTAPDDSGAAVYGYDVRVSETPIADDASFDAALRVPYLRVPAQPGGADGVDVPDMLIEHDYYFALKPFDQAGNRGPLTSVGPARASFERMVLVGEGGSNEQFGRSVDGSTDLNQDGFADLVVGPWNGSRVYIYFGSAQGYASTASVRIAGKLGVQFGAFVQVVGDLDADGLPELAVGAPSEGPGVVYLFKGRTSWPANLSFTDAAYLITADESVDPRFSGANLGGALARLGDFDGDGANDFAVGAPWYDGNRGYVAVIRGVRPTDGAFPATVSLTTASSRYIATSGPVDSLGRLGSAVTSLGKFYPSEGTTMMVAAYRYGATPAVPGDNWYGGVYGFAGQLDATQPADFVMGTSRNRTAGFSIAALGPLASPMAVAYSAPGYDRTGGTVAIHVGNVSTGPFVSAPTVLSSAAENANRNGFGSCVISSAISGLNASFSDHKGSFIGSTLPDVVISSLGRGAPAAPANVYFINGQKVPTLASGDISSVADVVVSLPPEWVDNSGCSPDSRAVRDLNNDGYADLAIGQYRFTGEYQGAVVVLW